MKTTRKVLSLLLVLAMVSALLVVGVTAEGEGANTVEPVKLPALGKNGVINGMPENAEIVEHLSDLHDQSASLTLNDYVVDTSTNTKINLNKTYSTPSFYHIEGSRKDGSANLVDGYRTFTLSDGTVLKPHKESIVLSYKGILFEKGLGVHPDAPGTADRYIVYNISTLNADRFYALVGANGSELTKNERLGRAVTFELWGSTAETYDKDTTEFVKLAYVDDIRVYVVGEFDIDISGYNFIKLVVKVFDAPNDTTTPTNSSSAVSWGEAALYNLPDYTLNYDGNGGKTANDETTLADSENKLGVNLAALTVTADANAFVKEGYAFTGWNTAADGTGTAFAVGAEVALTANTPVTLYAQWEELPPAITYYNVTLMVDGQAYGVPIQVAEGENATLPAVPEKEGYIGTWDHNGENITADTTINAVYTKKTYTVTFVIPGQENTTATVNHGEDATLPSIPEKSGFIGIWDKDGKNITADTTITLTYILDLYSPTSNFKVTATDATAVAGATDLADWRYVESSYVMPKGDAERFVGVNAVYGTENGTTTTPVSLEIGGESFGKFFSLHPTPVGDDKEGHVVLDLTGVEGNYFYSVVGIQNQNAWAEGSNIGVVFRVYGSTAANGEWTLLACSGDMFGKPTGEFLVNIEGYTFLKLEVDTNKEAADHSSRAVLFGNPCVFTADLEETYTVTVKVEGQEDITYTVEYGTDVTLPTLEEKEGYIIKWSHDGKNITADTVITATYIRKPTTVQVKPKDDPKGIGSGASNKHYLSDLHDASEDGKNLGLNQYVIDQGNNSKIVLNASYAQPSYYFIEGARKVGNGKGVDANGYRTWTLSNGKTLKVHMNDIVLGKTGTLYKKALGVHPNAKGKADRFIVYDVSTLDVNHFYAVAGATANGITLIDPKAEGYDKGRQVTFEVWGSMDETYDRNTTEFIKLAYVDGINGYKVGTFNVNISNMNFIKLVVKVSEEGTTNDSSAVAWGGACFYSREGSADTSDSFSMTAVAAAIVAATSVVALVVAKKKFF